jgi:AcrR family transcriptional regulator
MDETTRQPLNRQRVLDAAVRVVDGEGLAALTMRRLGRELGVEAMSLYRHVPNKEALLDGVVETVLGELEMPSPTGGDWVERLRRQARAFRRLAHRHPEVFPLIVFRPARTQAELKPILAALEIMREAGFALPDALAASRALTAYVGGYALLEGTRFERTDDDESATAWPSPSQVPWIGKVPPALRAMDHDEAFEFGLDALLDGLQARRPE